jgi:hypothetical protein
MKSTSVWILSGGMLVCGEARIASAQCGLGAAYLGAAVVGSAVFDIAKAPSSVRAYNRGRVVVTPRVDTRFQSFGLSVSVFPARHDADARQSPKSPRAGLGASLAATVLPVAVGVLASNLGAPESVGIGLAIAGVELGPSAGHLYADQQQRAFSGIAWRVGLSAIAIASASGCSPD